MSGGLKFSRSGPVHFQPLERELAPVTFYFRGRLLNAGCGERDLSAWLAALGVAEVVQYDIASGLPRAVIGPLEALPFADSSFDSILCNAVLEHVEKVDEVVAELARVLRPGGHAVIAVPFLQPYHQCPADYRRYTREGLVALGEKAGLSAVAVNPVHSAAQTIGWILWSIAQEKGRLMRAVVWPLVYAWTRLSIATDPAIQRNANTYQIVFRRDVAH
ncbi:MAG TPA: class I SAM-dependent methyltransferase [Allosphingosinicella sp.]|jgi:SAM-dependent methyltransferase